MLEVSFVRNLGSHDRVYVTRSDGASTGWDFPTYGDGLSHDLCHLVVEEGLGLAEGFWGPVSEGSCGCSTPHEPKETQVHANSPLTVRGRIMLVERVGSGRPIAHVAAEMGISRKTVTKWWRRFQDEGLGGLEDRSSRPQRCPHRTPALVEQKILRLRTRRKLGPARISSILDVPASTVHQVLVRAGMNRIAWMDRPTGQVIRRIRTDRPTSSFTWT